MRDGDVKSCYELGRRYERGIGTSVNEAEAASWYQRAFAGDGVGKLQQLANQGDATSQFIVGRMYDKGQEVAQKDTDRY